MLLACHVDVVGKKSLHTSGPISHLLFFDYVLACHLVAKAKKKMGSMPNLHADPWFRLSKIFFQINKYFHTAKMH